MAEDEIEKLRQLYEQARQRHLKHLRDEEEGVGPDEGANDGDDADDDEEGQNYDLDSEEGDYPYDMMSPDGSSIEGNSITNTSAASPAPAATSTGSGSVTATAPPQAYDKSTKSGV